MKRVLAFVLLLVVFSQAATAAEATNTATNLQWINFPDARLEVRGLPWFNENQPELWRLPKSAKGKVPSGVWQRAIAPDGGRICFTTDSSTIALRAERRGRNKKHCFFDAYVDGTLAAAAELEKDGEHDIVLFRNKGKRSSEITIYLPNNDEVRLIAVGIDPASSIKKPASTQLPIVCYGSSVLQGTGATHPAKTYPAIVARNLDRDFVNLGFGGAGKAEPAVVNLVNQIDGCCYLFDLGKSYGEQGRGPFLEMLRSVRAAHSNAPIICVTPIYSTKEASESGYKEKSDRFRDWMRTAANELRTKGDTNVFIVEGLDLFGPADKELFSDPLHPGDEGNERIASRLTPVVRRCLGKDQ